MSIVPTLYWNAGATDLTPGGTDLRSVTGMRVRHIQLRAPGLRRGDDDVIPGRDGELGAALPLAKYAYSVFVRIFGATPEEFEDNLAAIGALLMGSSRGLGVATRRLPAVADPFYVEHCSLGRFAGGLSLDPRPGGLTGVAELQFVNLSAAWTADGGTTWLAP